MADGFFDRNLKRLLRTAQKPVEARPLFQEALRRRLQDEAGRMREATRTDDAAEAAAPVASPARVAPWRAAAAAIFVIASTGAGVWLWRNAAHEEPSQVRFTRPEMAPLRLAADRAVVMSVRRGAEGAVTLERSGVELARLDLKDGAEVGFQPDRAPVLALSEGVVRVQARRDVRVRAAPVELAVGAGSDVEVERIMNRGESPMNKSWLIPGGAVVAAGAITIAVLVHQGNVEVKSPETRPVLLVAEKPLVVETPATRPVVSDDRDDQLAQAHRKISELEKKLAAAKKESDKLASELVQKKGVTIESITARLAELRKGTLTNAMLPGKTAELIADLKGLGAAGTQALLDMLKSEDANDRAIAAKLLEDLNDPAAISALRDVALNDADKTAATMAGHALALMGDPGTTDALKDILSKKRSGADVINSLWGLVNLGDRQGMEQALAYMNDKAITENHRAILAANVAAIMTDRPDVMPIVDAMVRDFNTSEQIMDIAVTYYRRIGTPDARSRLQGIADNAQVAARIRNAARDALTH